MGLTSNIIKKNSMHTVAIVARAGLGTSLVSRSVAVSTHKITIGIDPHVCCFFFVILSSAMYGFGFVQVFVGTHLLTHSWQLTRGCRIL